MRKLTKYDIESILLTRKLTENFKRLEDFPHPHNLKDLEKASKRIAKTIKNGEKIALVGDYDVDGVISSVIVKEFFDMIDYPLEVYIPNRFSDGYGVSEKIINRIDCDLIITVDNGIGAFKAGLVAKERGIDLIITDHHTPADILPEAYAIVNPKLQDCRFEFKDICGANVAWYLIAGIKKELKVNIDLKIFFDILSIAIVADVMPLIEMNRIILQKGLEYINNSKRVSIDVIKEFLNRGDLKSEDIAFQIAPRLNSAGRMKDASLAFNFLYSKDIEEARYLFGALDELNLQRREVERELSNLAYQKVNPNDNIAVVYSEHWHEGVIGIVASRIAEEFERPAIVFSINGDVAKGSARSYGDIDILKEIDKQKELLFGYGGHKQAGGLSLHRDNLEQFRIAINESFKIDEYEDFQNSSILGVIDMGEVDFELINILNRFEPFGVANPKPKFLAQDLLIDKYKEIGKNGEHRKFTFYDKKSDTFHDGVAFRCERNFEIDEVVSFEFTISINRFNNRESLQLLIDRFV